MISPTVGMTVRVYRPSHSLDVSKPELGHICFVNSDGTINVVGADKSGARFVLVNLVLNQEIAAMPDGVDYAEWMPLEQIQSDSQAGKSE